MTATYDIGDKITITGTFTNLGTPTDPAAVRVRYRLESGTVTTLIYGVDASLTKSSTGVYVFSILCPAVSVNSIMHYRMDDNGVNVATEGDFFIRGGAF